MTTVNMFLTQNRKKGDHGVIKNESPNIAWKLKNNEAYKEVFTEIILKNCPMLYKTRRCCRSWALKGYCFKDYKNIASHCDWPNEINSSCD